MTATTKLSHLKIKQDKRFVIIRRMRRLALGVGSFDIGLGRTFESSAIDAIGRDFRAVGGSLFRHMWKS